MTIPDGGPTAGPDPADLAFGAFSSHPPWVLDLDRLSWSAGIDGLRATDAGRGPPAHPPAPAPARGRGWCGSGAVLGTALAGWYVVDRRRGQHRSRAGLSRRLRRAFERLGPTYIKLGQILSSGEGLFPEELVAEFRLCATRSRPSPSPWCAASSRPTWACRSSEQFSEFDRAPIAAASIAQVHAARLAHRRGRRGQGAAARRGHAWCAATWPP